MFIILVVLETNPCLAFHSWLTSVTVTDSSRGPIIPLISAGMKVLGMETKWVASADSYWNAFKCHSCEIYLEYSWDMHYRIALTMQETLNFLTQSKKNNSRKYISIVFAKLVHIILRKFNINLGKLREISVKPGKFPFMNFFQNSLGKNWPNFTEANFYQNGVALDIIINPSSPTGTNKSSLVLQASYKKLNIH